MSNSEFISSLLHGQSLKPGGSKLVIAEWTAPGTPAQSSPEFIAPLHAHHNDDEAWYVLEGKLGFQIGDERIEAVSNQAVIVPSGTPHTYWNAGSEEAKYLIIMTTRISRLIDEIHRMEQRDMDAMKALFREFDSELL